MSEGPRYSIEWSTVAARALRKLPKEVGRRLVDAVNGMASNPRPNGYRKLEDSKEDYRVRVGEYRIIYQIQDRNLLIIVIDVGPRKDIYRRRKP